MENCTKFVFKAVNQTHTHFYSHAKDMKIITGIGVGCCVLAVIAFTIWVIWKKIKNRREAQQGPVQFGLGYLND